MNAPTSLRPGDGSGSPSFEVVHAGPNLGGPCRLGIGINVGIEGPTPQDPVDQVEFNRFGGKGNVGDYLANASTMLSDLQALYGGVEYLRDLSGQRHLIYISNGGISPPRYEDDRSLARRAADARVILDFLHGFGSVFSAQTSRFVTKMTGGQFHASHLKNHSADVDR